MITFHSVVVFVKEIQTAKKFYQKVFGLKIEHDFGKNIIFKSGLAIWEIGEKHVIPKKLGNLYTDIGNKFELYFETTDIQTVYANLREQDVVFLHEVHEEPWGQKAIRFFDPDKHLIEVGETLQTFVKRMHSEGMSAEDIHEKSSIPIDTIRQLLE